MAFKIMSVGTLVLFACLFGIAFGYHVSSSTQFRRSRLEMVFGGSKKAPAKSSGSGFTITVEQQGFKSTGFPTSGTVNLRKKLMEVGVDIYPLQGKIFNCGGGGSCGTCAVQVLAGDKNLSPKAPVEKKLLANKPESYRLSCCTRVSGDCTIKTKPK